MMCDDCELRDMIEDLNDEIQELKDGLSLYENCVNPINDLDNFIERLKLENLYSKELEEFIEKYMKFYNE